jgi:hypothetical protein
VLELEARPLALTPYRPRPWWQFWAR